MFVCVNLTFFHHYLIFVSERFLFHLVFDVIFNHRQSPQLV